MTIPSFDDYLDSLGPIVPPVDLLADTDESEVLRGLADELATISPLGIDSIAAWISGRSVAVRFLGLAVGLGQERLKNICKHNFGTAGFSAIASKFSHDFVLLLDGQYRLVEALEQQRTKAYTFGDVMVARAGSRGTASRAGQAGRILEDQLEAIADELGLRYLTRGRFSGRGGETAPFDLAIIDKDDEVVIAVAAKGFDSTGSKLTDAVREIEQMVNVHTPSQYLFAAVDGIGWKMRQSDLRRIHSLWTSKQIQGVFSVNTLDEFRTALSSAASRLDLLPDVG